MCTFKQIESMCLPKARPEHKSKLNDTVHTLVGLTLNGSKIKCVLKCNPQLLGITSTKD